MIYLAYALAVVVGLGYVGHWALAIVLALLWTREVIRAGKQLPGGNFQALGVELFTAADRGISRRISVTAPIGCCSIWLDA